MSPTFVFALRRHWKVLASLPILAVVLVVVFAPGGTKATRYVARETVAADLENGRGNFAQIQQAIFLVRQPEIADVAAAKLGLLSRSAGFADRIQVQTDTVSYTIAFSAQGAAREETEQYVDAFATAFVERLNAQGETTVSAATEAVDQAIADKQAELDGFRLLNAAALNDPDANPGIVSGEGKLEQDLRRLQDGRVQAISDAERAQLRYRALGLERTRTVAQGRLNLPEGRPARAGIAFVLAVALAGVLVLVMERLAPRVSGRTEAEELVGAPVLAMVPALSARRLRTLARVRPETFVGPLAESYRTLRSHLDFLDVAPGEAPSPERKGSIIVVVSPTPGDGKSFTSSYLSLALAETDRRVLLLGCDFRRPTVHARLGLSGVPGFSTRRTDPTTPVTELIQNDPETGVDLIASGPATARTSDLLPEVRVVAETARAAGRTVIIDTAPVLVASDALELAGLADRIILVLRAGQTLERSTTEAVAALGLNNSPISGIVLIGSLEASEASHYYYNYYRVDE